MGCQVYLKGLKFSSENPKILGCLLPGTVQGDSGRELFDSASESKRKLQGTNPWFRNQFPNFLKQKPRRDSTSSWRWETNVGYLLLPFENLVIMACLLLHYSQRSKSRGMFYSTQEAFPKKWGTLTYFRGVKYYSNSNWIAVIRMVTYELAENCVYHLQSR